MDPAYYGLIELLLTAVGAFAFVWWQLRSLRRDRAITAARKAERRGTEGAGSASRPHDR